MTRYWTIFICMFYAASASAAPYAIDHTKSSVRFSGNHADKPFTGEFKQWRAIIEFDEHALDKSRIEVTFDMASAVTGEAMYDGTLPTADWFNVKEFPQAIFTSNSVTRNSQGGFRAEGILTIRGKAQPMAFDFTLTTLENGSVKASALFNLDRLAFDIGKGSDAKAEWVSQHITITIMLEAQKN